MDPKVQEMLDKFKAAAQSVGENAERGARYAGKKAAEIWDVGKLNLKILELRGDIASLYEDLGKLVYSVHKGKNADDSAVEAMIAALDEKAEALAECKKKLREMRGQKICPSCGNSCGEDDAFCKRCGATLQKDKEKQEDKEEQE